MKSLVVPATRKAISPSAAVVLLSLLIGYVLNSPYWTDVAINVLIFAILALSWDIMARLGCISFGQAAFFGIGAYGAAVVGEHAGLVAGWVSGVAIACLVGAGVGRATLGLRGMYFTIATFSLTLALSTLVLAIPSITGGGAGISPDTLFAGNGSAQLMVFAAIAVAASVVSSIYLTGRFRAAVFLIRSNDGMARASGVPVLSYRVRTFVLSGAIAALAGAMYSALYGFMVPTDVFTLNWSVIAVAAAIVGGVDSTWGPLIGGAVLYLLQVEAEHVVGASAYTVAYGLAIIIVVLFFKQGVFGGLRRLWLALGGPVRPGRRGIGLGDRKHRRGPVAEMDGGPEEKEVSGGPGHSGDQVLGG